MTVDVTSELLADVVGVAPHLYLSVLTSNGPLVTPELYSSAGGRLWCLTARQTAKARLTDDGDNVGVALVAPNRSAVLQCTAERFDPAQPATLVTKLVQMGDAAAGLTTFLGRNGIEMAGAARDAVLGRLGRPLPAVRLLFGLEPTASLVLTGDAVDELQGAWPAPTPASDTAATAATAPTGMPDVGPHAATVVGWLAGDKPIAFPAQWIADDNVARVPAALFDAVGANRAGPASLCFDQWSGTGPSGKQGMVVRGAGAARTDAGFVDITLAVEQVTTWDGVEVDSRSA